jgi:hypothetical protein
MSDRINFFSPSANDGRGAFFSAAIHGDALPADAIKLTARQYREMMEGQAAGRSIVPGADGRPKFAPVKRQTLEQLRTGAVRVVKGEARRRILAIASIERQTNDNAAMVVAAATGQPTAEATAALGRRRAIDAIRTASNAIETTIARMPAANLTSFDATAARLWPAQE